MILAATASQSTSGVRWHQLRRIDSFASSSLKPIDLITWLLSETILPRVSVIELSFSEIIAALGITQSRGVRGGCVYDFMHLVAAKKANASVIHAQGLNGGPQKSSETGSGIQEMKKPCSPSVGTSSPSGNAR